MRTSLTLQQHAVEEARLTFAKLPGEDALFQQCVSQDDAVIEMVNGLQRKYKSHRRKKSSLLVERFERYTTWLQNFSGVVDVVAQTEAGIGCPIWAPVKFVLQVR
jgi:hypothetical protein